MSTAFDPDRYRRAPVLTITAAITLGRALLAKVPTPVPDFLKKSVAGLTAAIDRANAALGQRQGKLTQSGRPVDQEADASWSGLRARLEGYASLPATRYPRAARAAELIDLLFGADGLSFLRLPYTEQWSVMGAILSRIDKEQLKGDIDTLCGPEFLDQLNDVQGRYGEMIERALKQGEDVDISEPLRQLRQAINTYATKALALIEDDQPETTEEVRAMLEPIDALRRQQAERRARAARDSEDQGQETPPAPSPSTTPPAPSPSTTPPRPGTGTTTQTPSRS